jgi:hypothetical protein
VAYFTASLIKGEPSTPAAIVIGFMSVVGWYEFPAE